MSANGVAPGGPSRPGASNALRPRDAGTLILVDESEAVPKILLGRRSSRLVFMPGQYVFPGGRLEASDVAMAGAFRLDPKALERLLAATSHRFDERRAAGIALAALRETFEETGLLVGRAGQLGPLETGPAFKGPVWPRFAAAGMAPDPARLVPVARAITPPGHPRRYDTRFFCASAADIQADLSLERPLDDEFDHIGWFSIDSLEPLDLPRITRHVLSDVDARLRDGSWRDGSRPMPFYRTHRGRAVREMI